MWFALLGPLLVTDDDAEVPVTAPKLRVLLASLLTQPGQQVSAGELAELVWDGKPPAGAGVTLRSYVKRLRQVLGPQVAARIETRPSGYRIEAGEQEVDLTCFADLCRRGEAAACECAWQPASALLTQALGLWRGAPLSDIPSQLLQDREVPHLEKLRLRAAELRIDAELQLGNHGQIIPELHALTVAHPLHEQFYARLMLALCRTGQRAAALDVYRRARHVVVNDLGIEVSPELQDLNQRILAGDEELHRPLATARMQLATPMQLPPAVRHFTGREDLQARLTSFLDREMSTGGPAVLLAIHGPAGVGKSALAVHWAYEVAGRFPDGVLYTNMRGFDQSGTAVTPSQTIRGFLDAFAVPADRIPNTLDAQASLYRSIIAGKRVLVILDNVKDADQARPLLPGSQGCAVVVTSRSQLGPLAASNGSLLVALDVLPHDKAYELLAKHIDAGRLAAEPDAVDEMIRLSAGLPLALRILIARASVNASFPLAAFIAEIKGTQGMLGNLDMGDPSSSVETAFSWSYGQLTDDAARAFRMLSVHPGPDMTVPAMACLLDMAQAQTRRALDELVRLHLLAEYAPDRFNCHELLRAYAANQARAIDSAADRQAAIKRLMDYFLGMAYACALAVNPARDENTLISGAPRLEPGERPGLRQAMTWFTAEHRTLFAAMMTAVENGFDSHAWQLAWTPSDFYERRGYWQEWVAAQKLAVAAAMRLGDIPAQACTRRVLGRALTEAGAYDQARRQLRSSRALYRQLRDRGGEASTLTALSRLYECQRRYDLAADHARQALSLFQRAGWLPGQARALNGIGWFSAQAGDLIGAQHSCEQAVHLYKQVGDLRGQAATWDSLGYIQHKLGNHAESIRCYRKALRLFRRLGERSYQADTFKRLGDCYQSAGDAAAAYESWRDALRILEDLDDPGANQLRIKLEVSHLHRALAGPGGTDTGG
jgi:DNA-binding SARP family transcriptional activator